MGQYSTQILQVRYIIIILEFLLNFKQFGRRWIIQELVKSPPGARHVFFGSYHFRFEELMTAIRKTYAGGSDDVRQALRGSSLISCFVNGYIDNVFAGVSHQETSSSKPGYISSSRVDLLSNLSAFKRAACSNAHDLVYALLSLSSDGSRFPVNYASKLEDVYSEVAKRYLETPNDTLRLLAIASSRHDFRHPKLDIPSWIPDWRAGALFESLSHIRAVKSATSSMRGALGALHIKDFHWRDAIAQISERDNRTLLVHGRLLRRCGHAVDYNQLVCEYCQQFGSSLWSLYSSQHKEFGGDKSWIPQDRDTAILYFPDTIIVFVLRESRISSGPATMNDDMRDKDPEFSIHSCFMLSKDPSNYFSIVKRMTWDTARCKNTSPTCIT